MTVNFYYFHMLKKALKSKFKSLALKALPLTQKISNIGHNTTLSKRAALIYLTVPFLKGFEKNLPNEANIKNILGELLLRGFIVDIYNYDSDVSCYKKEKYDLIIGFGPFFYYLTSLHKFNHYRCKIISYFAELDPEYTKRIEYLRYKKIKEKGIKISTKNLRGADYYDVNHHKYSDYLIFTGPKSSLHFFKFYSFKKKIAIQPSIVALSPFVKKERDLNQFCWIGSFGGAIKGLDLLVESFKSNPNIELHLFGVNKVDEILFDGDLPQNIKNHGFVDMSSKAASVIVQKCKFVIATSFSEGSSTGVLTGMGYGCIPVVTEYTGTEGYKNHIIFIKEISVSGILEAIDKAQERYSKNKEVNLHSSIASFSRREFYSKGYIRRLKNALDAIL